MHWTFNLGGSWWLQTWLIWFFTCFLVAPGATKVDPPTFWQQIMTYIGTNSNFHLKDFLCIITRKTPGGSEKRNFLTLYFHNFSLFREPPIWLREPPLFFFVKFKISYKRNIKWLHLVAPTGGFYWWSLLVAHTGGSYCWLLLVAPIGGSYWWLLLVAPSGGSYWWLLLMAPGGHHDFFCKI